MDTSKIVEKALKGEDYSADVKDFSDEDKTKVALAIRDAADVAAKENLKKMNALKLESERREEKKDEGKKAEDVVLAFAGEQMSEAKKRFFSNPDLKLTDAEKAKIEAEFKTSKIDANLIVEDLERFYVSLNPKKFLADSKKATELEKGAANYNAGAANGGSSGGGSPDESKYSEAAKTLFRMWQSKGLKKKTLDEAESIIKRGDNWQTRRLG